MDANQLRKEVSDRFEEGVDWAGRAANKARNAYERVEERLPEGSMKYAQFALAGLAVGMVGYQLGKSRARRSSPIREIAKNAGDRIDQFDYTPFYKLAKLWLLTRIAL